MFNGKMKAVTFSYDDGVTADRKLVKILNKYGLKCTFNLNSEVRPMVHKREDGKTTERFDITENADLYKGHEIAVHTCTHPHLNDYDYDRQYQEIARDKENLSRIFKQDIVGMALPYGLSSCNDITVKAMKDAGMAYSRGTAATHSFDIQKDLLPFNPTCHHKDPLLMELSEKFVNMKADKPQIFYIWGHSYEFDLDENWDKFIEFCEFISGKDDIFYGTNKEVLL
ncbi:MAG: polysaccharide deacetylase family protein [Bacillota bacterium]|nr:polysaccharide deacetylase family protein [Bacillota bacterium]